MVTATYTGRANILSAVEAVSDHNPYFSIWRGRDILTQNSTNDWDAAYIKLDDLLQALEQSGNKDLITIKFHPKPDKDGYITNKTAIVSSMLVRVLPLDSISGIASQSNPTDLNNAAWYMLKEIKDGVTENRETQATIINRLALLESKPPDVEDEGLLEPDMLDKIGAILEKPGITDLLAKFAPVITGILSKYMDIPNMAINGAPNERGDLIAEKSGTGSANVEALAGNAQNSDTSAIPHLNDAQYDQLDMVIYRLKKHTETPILDLDLLCNWADANPVMFKSLISSLK